LAAALGWDLEAGKAQVFGAGDAPISVVALGDVAAYAVEVIEQAVGKKFKVTTVPGFVPTLASMVLRPFNPKLASLMGLGAETLTGDVIDPATARTFAALPLTSLAEWAQRRT
jgi:hypothetical protein